MASKLWAGAGKRALARNAVQKAVATSLVTSYKKVKRTPEDLYNVSFFLVFPFLTSLAFFPFTPPPRTSLVWIGFCRLAWLRRGGRESDL